MSNLKNKEVIELVNKTEDIDRKLEILLDNLTNEEFDSLCASSMADIYMDDIFDSDDEVKQDFITELLDIIEYRETYEKNRLLLNKEKIKQDFLSLYEIEIWDNDICEYVIWDKEEASIRIKEKTNESNM